MKSFYFFILLITFLNLINLIPLKQQNPKKVKDIKERKLADLSDDIVIIHLNDVHCSVNDYIGYDGFVLYRNELKKKYKNVISVDVGDNIQGGTLGAITSGEAIVTVLNKVEFDVNILGNHEFDYSIEKLQELQNKMTSKYICANFCTRKDNKPVFDPYKIIEVTLSDDTTKKIAFIGIVTPKTFSNTYLSTIKDSDGNAIYNFLSEGDLLAETVQKYIDQVTSMGADYVILLAHVGMKIDELYTSEGLLSKLKGVTAVLDGHTHVVYNTTSKDIDGKFIHITQTGTKLEHIGELIIRTDGTITAQNINEVPEPEDKTGAIKVTRNYADRWVDTEMNTFIEDLWKEYDKELNIPVGTLSYDMIIKPNASEPSSSIICRFQECTLGNLCADSFKEVLVADLAMINGGDIRVNLLQGNLTKKNIIEVVPFFSTVILNQCSGQTILDVLEMSVSRLPNSFGGFLQVSGITFDVNTSISSPVITDADGMFVNINGKRRISNVEINGIALDENKKYNISMSEYLSLGGDGYSMFSQCKLIDQSIYAESDALIYYISNDLNGDIPSKYKNEEGRINIDEQFNEIYESRNESIKNFGKFLILTMFFLL